MTLIRTIAIAAMITFSAELSLAQNVPANTGSKVSPREAQAGLDLHNKARKALGIQPLEWSSDLAKYAQAWADHLAAGSCTPDHRPFNGPWKLIYGENTFMTAEPQGAPLQAAQDWINEAKLYKHRPMTVNDMMTVGHYSQMVWRNSARIGIGVGHCRDGEVLVIANYDPIGNLAGQLAY